MSAETLRALERACDRFHRSGLAGVDPIAPRFIEALEAEGLCLVSSRPESHIDTIRPPAGSSILDLAGADWEALSSRGVDRRAGEAPDTASRPDLAACIPPSAAGVRTPDTSADPG